MKHSALQANQLLSYFLIITLCFTLISCHKKQSDFESTFHKKEITDVDLDKLGITNKNYLSAASKRALAWPDLGNEWFG